MFFRNLIQPSLCFSDQLQEEIEEYEKLHEVRSPSLLRDIKSVGGALSKYAVSGVLFQDVRNKVRGEVVEESVKRRAITKKLMGLRDKGPVTDENDLVESMPDAGKTPSLEEMGTEKTKTEPK